MRLWTVHPKYLDPRGLTALWRETLLARAVLRGRTRGYRQHPQLRRFRESPAPQAAIGAYLRVVYEEALRRGYRFDARKIGRPGRAARIVATQGQLEYEWRHLRSKLRVRNPKWYASVRAQAVPEAHPLFRIVAGDVADWEVRHKR